MNSKKFGIPVVVCFSIVALLFCSCGSFAENWQPFQFEGNETYRYRVKWGEEKRESAVYRLSIEENEEGNYQVEYSTEVEVEPSELNSEVAFGYWESYGPSLHFMFLNPMYEMLFEELELKVGEKMSYYGRGTMEVTGREEVAGREGYVCRLFDSEEEFLAEWVVDPELALPLRSINSELDKGEGEIVLLEYEKL